MAWCRQATSHYLSQCWPSSMSPYGVTRPQWVNLSWKCESVFIWDPFQCLWLHIHHLYFGFYLVINDYEKRILSEYRLFHGNMCDELSLSDQKVTQHTVHWWPLEVNVQQAQGNALTKCQSTRMYMYDIITWNRFPHYWPFVRGILKGTHCLLTKDQ